MEKQSGSGTSRFIWDAATDAYLIETDASNVTQATYTTEPADFGKVISQRRSNQTSYYHFDALGSTRALSDAAETVTDTNLYDALGVNLTSTGVTENPFGWVGAMGYYYDRHPDIMYIRAKLY